MAEPPLAAKMTEPLPARIGRAQGLLSRSLLVEPIGRRAADDRGGEGIETGDDVGLSCTSQSTCISAVGDDMWTLRVGEDVSSRERVDDGMRCEVDEEWDAPCGPRRGGLG
jgi:hypothetical protein